MSEIVRGKTTEERLASIEHVLESHRRRLGTKVVGLVPPVPILHRQTLPEIGGMVFEGISPMSGVVTRLCIRVGHYTQKSATFIISVLSNDKTYSVKRSTSTEISILAIDQRVEAGDVVTLVVDPPDGVEDILIGILIAPDMAQMRQEHYLLDSLLALEEPANA